MTLSSAFDFYVRIGDFVGADMARKFIQMGMTRAGRYANRAGGKKYAKTGGAGGKKVLLPLSEGHKGQAEKRGASNIFRAQWIKCKENEEYRRLKSQWSQGLKQND